MALPVTDAFTDPNGTALTTHSASWVQNGGAFIIQSNTLQPNAAATEFAAHWTGDGFADDQYAQATLGSSAQGSHYIGPAIRVAAGATKTYYGYYGCAQAGLDQNRQFFKNVAGTWTQFGSNGTGTIAGEVLRLEAVGSTIRPLRNGSLDVMGEVSDSAVVSGSGGIAGWALGTMFIDDWESGDIVPYVVPIIYPFAITQRIG